MRKYFLKEQIILQRKNKQIFFIKIIYKTVFQKQQFVIRCIKFNLRIVRVKKLNLNYTQKKD